MVHVYLSRASLVAAALGMAMGCSVGPERLLRHAGSTHGGDGQALQLAATNLLLNPGFESDNLANWSIWESKAGVTLASTKNARSGTRAALQWSSARGPFQSLLFQTVAVPNGTYQMSCYLRGQATNSLLLQASKYRGDNAAEKLSQTVPASSSYQLATLSGIQVTAGSLTIGIWMDGTTNDYVNIDDCSLTSTSNPTPAPGPAPAPAPAPAPQPTPTQGTLCTTSAPAGSKPTGRVFYVSPSGNDSNSGLSAAAPWKTLGRLSSTLRGGDQALLQGGATFNESLYFGPVGGGISTTSDATPIFISTYGTGRATLQTSCANKRAAIFAYNQGGIEVSNLKLVGCADPNLRGPGVSTWNDDNITHKHLYFDNMDVSSYNFGFQFQNQFSDISVTNSVVHDNESTGIYFGGGGVTKGYAGHNEVYNITKGFGYGIYYFDTFDGLAEYNVVHAVGGAGAAYGQGLAVQNSQRVTLQYNEIYNILKGAAADDNGVIIDAESADTITQYNYIHDIPAGAGVTLAEWTTMGIPYINHTVRYNLIVNVGTGIYFLGQIAAYPANGTVYNNTIISANGQQAIWEYFNIGTVNFYNNAFIGQNGTTGITVAPDTLVAQKMQNNGYYSPGAPYSFNYRGKTYAGLQAFRSGTELEGGSGAPAGIEASPLLNLPATAPTLGLAKADIKPSLLGAYKISPTSPFAGKGTDLQSTYGINPGTHDFWCNAISKNLGN